MKDRESFSTVNKRIWESFVPDYVDERMSEVLALLPFLGGGARYLDIGCTSGVMTERCARRIGTTEVFGIDLVHTEEAKKRGIEVKTFDLNISEPLPFESGSFDVITCLETIEHLHDTDHILSEIFRLLKPEGTAVIDLPRLDSWMNIFMLLTGFQPPGVECSVRKRYGAVNEESFLTGHISYFTKRAFLEMLSAHNLRVVGFRQVSQRSNWLLVQKKLGRKTGPIVRAAWWLYDMLPFKKDYMIFALKKNSGNG